MWFSLGCIAILAVPNHLKNIICTSLLPRDISAITNPIGLPFFYYLLEVQGLYFFEQNSYDLVGCICSVMLQQAFTVSPVHCTVIAWRKKVELWNVSLYVWACFITVKNIYQKVDYLIKTVSPHRISNFYYGQWKWCTL